MKKVILYINQFFGSVGGEDQADFEPMIQDGPVGPGLAIQSALKDAEITHTVICGDNFMNSHRAEALERIQGFLEGKDFDLFLAGPAFLAGRYGMSCGEMCKFVEEHYHVPTVTSMNEENPGVDAYRGQGTYILKGGKNAAKMRKDAGAMAAFANKIIAGEPILWADAEGYFKNGVRKEVFVEKTSADRAVDMLLQRLAGEPFETEYKIEVHEGVAPAPAVKDASKAKFAIVNTGGLVPTGNPDRMPSATATIWKTYDISEMDELKGGDFFSVHGGYATKYVNENPEYLLPVSSVKELVKEGVIGELYPAFYSTTGNITGLKDAKRMGHEIALDLKEKGVDGVIFVST